MAHAHRTDQCRVCNRVLRTCRCIGPKDIWWTTCSACLAKPAQPQPKTVRVRIAVSVDSRGHWNAAGVSGSGSDELMRAAVLDDELLSGETVVHFIEATVPLPESVTVEGEAAE